MMKRVTTIHHRLQKNSNTMPMRRRFSLYDLRREVGVFYTTSDEK